jgi:hypothetical protein
MIIKTSVLVFTIIVGLNSILVFDFASSLLGQWFGVFISPNALSAGRYFAISVFSEELALNQSVGALIFGNGPGFSTYFLQVADVAALSDKHFPLLHNDILRAFSDYGIIGLLAISILSMRLLLGGRLSSFFGVYTLILLLTDNAMTYFFYWLVLVSLLKLESAHCRREALHTTEDFLAHKNDNGR